MRRNNRGFLDALLLSLVWVIPLNIYIIGDWLGVGLQFCLFRIQETYPYFSFISVARELDFIIRLSMGLRTQWSGIFWVSASVLISFATIFRLFQREILELLGKEYRQRFRVWIGALLSVSAILVLLSVVAQYGPLFSGKAGQAFPVGVPLLLAAGWYFLATPEGRAPAEPNGTSQTDGKGHGAGAISYILLMAGLIILVTNFTLYMFPFAGGDFRVYCAAATAFHAGEDPYHLETILNYGSRISGFVYMTKGPFSYPPLTLIPLTDLCSFFQGLPSLRLYYILYFIILAMGIPIIRAYPLTRPDPFYAVTLYTTGLISVFWSFSTGNISILYAPIVALVFLFLIKRRYLLSSLCTSLLAAFSLFSVVFLSTYSILNTSRQEKARAISVSLGLLVLWLLASFLWNPALFLSYLSQFFSEGSPVLETENLITPTAYLCFRDILTIFHIYSIPLFIVVVAAYVLSISLMVYYFTLRNRSNSLILFSFLFIALFLLLPRLKPNYFVLILIPIYILTRDFTIPVKSIILLILSLVPTVILISIMVNILVLKPTLLATVLSYNQFFCALFIVILIAFQGITGRIASNTSEQ